MNNSSSYYSNGLLNNDYHGINGINGLSYFIGISIGVLILIITIALASYFCNRVLIQPTPVLQQRNQRNLARVPPLPPQQSSYTEEGIDEDVLQSYPKLLYSQAKFRKKDTTNSCCSICLADYKGTDTLRLLPDCGHLFHLECVDPWLRLHSTCPICRNSPLPTPLSTPQAEVAPLAIQQV